MEQFKSIETTELVKIANAIRLKKGSTDKISLADMPAMIIEIEGGGVKLPELSNEGTASDLLSGKQLIDDDGNIVTGNIPNNGAISSTMDGLNIKSITIPFGYTSGGTISLDNTIDNEVDAQADLLTQAVAALEGKAAGSGDGITLPVLDNPASASDILSGKKAIDSSGNVLTGTIATKTSSNLTASGATVTVPAGYYASQATKSVATATQATPSVSIDANGKITASATQAAGYVEAGTKTGAEQLTTKNATTYTPTTSDQTIASGTYLTGVQTIKGDANLKAENIAAGVSIFGINGVHSSGITPTGTINITVNGTYDVTQYASANVDVPTNGSGGGSAEYSENEDDILNRTITSYTNDRLTTVGSYAFYSCTKLSEVSFANATNIRNNAFSYCTSLTTADFPKVTSISASAFQNCHKLKTINMPNLTTTYSCAFNYCSSLTTVNCSNLATIGSFAFQQCYSLSTISFPNAATISGSAFRSCRTLCSLTVGTNKSTVCTLTSSTAFQSTPFAGYSSYFSGTPVIYVPASLLASYKTATNWTYFSKYMVGI